MHIHFIDYLPTHCMLDVYSYIPYGPIANPLGFDVHFQVKFPEYSHSDDMSETVPVLPIARIVPLELP